MKKKHAKETTQKRKIKVPQNKPLNPRVITTKKLTKENIDDEYNIYTQKINSMDRENLKELKFCHYKGLKLLEFLANNFTDREVSVNLCEVIVFRTITHYLNLF
uniref:Uncharacterized protein n=1 Tax=Acrobeloides nanus TaxID=290746 RepID=A0A914CRK9_9BILA